MLAGVGSVDYRVNGFCIYPRNKIDYIQEREMISNVSTNGYSLCMEVLFVLMSNAEQWDHRSDVSQYMEAVEKGQRIAVPLEKVKETFHFVEILPIADETTSHVISLLYRCNQYLVCPNAANAFVVGLKSLYKQRTGEDPSELEAVFDAVVNGEKECKLICLNTAHPGKFPYFVAEALNAPAGNIMPKDIQEL